MKWTQSSLRQFEGLAAFALKCRVYARILLRAQRDLYSVWVVKVAERTNIRITRIK